MAFLPITVALLVSSATAARIVPRTGTRPLLLAGTAACAGGLYWLSRLTSHSTYPGGLLGPTLLVVLAAGFDRAFLAGSGIALLMLVIAIGVLVSNEAFPRRPAPRRRARRARRPRRPAAGS